MVGDVVALLDLAAGEQGKRVDLVANVEKGREHALVGERLEDLGRRALVGPSSKVRITS